ncbi:MAG: HAD hydrolase-like protein, partial [Thermoleophilaceae bacterium]|nr:HAD hydrolase-like protein [Thermoleophilaceae bacterium]
ALLLRAVEMAGVSPAEAVHVGDSYADDVLGAQAAGVRALLLDRPAVGPYGASRSRAAPTGPAERITSLEQVLSVTWVDGPRAG